MGKQNRGLQVTIRVCKHFKMAICQICAAKLLLFVEGLNDPNSYYMMDYFPKDIMLAAQNLLKQIGELE